MNYRLAYALGFHPWEDLVTHRPFADKLLELVAREENGAGPSGRSALDLGTGSAVWGVELAKRGWRVTGVELVAKALDRAEVRIAEADVELRLVRGDVTCLSQREVGTGYRLLLDTGTFHGLDDGQRYAMATSVTGVAAADATLILDCFAPRWRGPLPRGAGRADVERAFSGWRITGVEIADPDPDAIARLARFDERFYVLRRA
jgi:SAM-dependent methyltransferase